MKINGVWLVLPRSLVNEKMDEARIEEEGLGGAMALVKSVAPLLKEQKVRVNVDLYKPSAWNKPFHVFDGETDIRRLLLFINANCLNPKECLRL